MRNGAVTIGIERLRRAGQISTVVDQSLSQPIPACNLITIVLMIHATKLDTEVVINIGIKGGLQQRLLCSGILIIAFRILEHAVNVVTEIPATELTRSTDAGG